MRCYCCNRALNDYESTRKSILTGEYIDTCSRCLEELHIDTTSREDLNPFEAVEDILTCMDREIEQE